MGMGNSFETITVLQYRLKEAQEELAAFQSGENISEWKTAPYTGACPGTQNCKTGSSCSKRTQPCHYDSESMV